MLRLCIPVHNEAPTIGVLLWRIRKVFQEFSREYDVTVFDDASTDGTAELLDPYRAVMPLTVLSAPRRVGYAAAVDALVRHVAADDEYARRDAMILLQGDFTDQPEQLPELIRRFEGGADVVAVARALDDAMPADERRLRRWGGWAVRPFVTMPAFTDPFGGFRLVRIAVLRDLLRAAGAQPVLAGGDPWAANADLALTLAPFARRIENVELPGRWDVRPRPSHHRAWPDTLMLFRWARGARRVARPQPKSGAPARGGEVPRPDGVEYVRNTAPPPPRPPRPTREELAASEAPSRRARRAPADRTEFAGPTLPPAASAPAAGAPVPAAEPARGERAARPERPERGERTERAERREKPARPAREERAPREERPPRDGTAAAERPAREKPPRDAAARAERRGTAAAPPTGEGDGHRHLRKVAHHPHAPVDPTTVASTGTPIDPSVVAPGVGEDVDDAAAPLALDGAADAPARKKRRRRRKKRGAAGTSDAVATEAADGDASETDDAPETDASAHGTAADGADGADGADDVDAGDDEETATGDAPSGARRKRRPRRRRRRARPSDGGDGVSGSGDADASSASAPIAPPIADGD